MHKFYFNQESVQCGGHEGATVDPTIFYSTFKAIQSSWLGSVALGPRDTREESDEA